MRTAFAALVFRTGSVPDRALSQGFAVALGGFDVPRPHLLLAELPGAPGWSAAFYQSGAKLAGSKRGASAQQDEEIEHARELFEDELHPAICALDAAAELGVMASTLYAILYAEDPLVDDVWRVGPDGFERRFARDDDEEGLIACVETADACEVTPLEPAIRDGASDAEERAAIMAAAAPHRGSAFLDRELGAKVVVALVGALFAPDRRVEIRLIDPSPDVIASETRRLNRALARTDGRGAFEPPASVAGVKAPEAYRAFVKEYDWADPADPQDLYRELSVGSIEGTLRFLRERDVIARGSGDAWKRAAARGLFPVAEILPSSLGRSRSHEATLALADDGERLVLVKPDGGVASAGPTFGELLRYLSLGWTSRTEEEEDFIGAIMLRAKIRVSA